MRISDWSFRRVLFRSAWSTDRGVPIVAGITEALRASCITLPAPSVIERAGIAGRARARQRTYDALLAGVPVDRSEEHTSELQSLMRISYAVICWNKKTITKPIHMTTA